MTGVVHHRGRAEPRDWAEAAGRAGLVARGVIYLVVAVIAVGIATRSSSGEQADPRGALDAIAEQSYGTVLLVLLAVGFASYATWRAVRAVVGEDPAEEPEPLQRVADVARALLHLGLLVTTISILQGGGSGSSSGQQQESWTARLMGEPWGRWLVALVGAALVAGGAWLAKRGVDASFREHLERTREWVVRLGQVGHVGRGLAFALIGGFLVRAAWQFDPNDPIGLDEALRDLAGSGWGTAVVLAVAAGLAAFGAFSIAEARDRRVLEGA